MVNHKHIRFNRPGPCDNEDASLCAKHLAVARMHASLHPALYGLAASSDGHFQATDIAIANSIQHAFSPRDVFDTEIGSAPEIFRVDKIFNVNANWPMFSVGAGL